MQLGKRALNALDLSRKKTKTAGESTKGPGRSPGSPATLQQTAPATFRASLEQALLAAWFPSAEHPSAKDDALAPKGTVGAVIGALVWLLTRSWLGMGAAKAIERLASKRRSRITIKRQQRPPVVVVGNLVAGGSGKTPLVVALAKALKEQGLRIAILCSGYGGKLEGQLKTDHYASPYEAWRAGWSDESVLLAFESACALFVGRNRSAALALCLSREPQLDLILSDDGLQHQGLERAYEILLIDRRGLGNRRCLPAGPLREPLKNRKPSDYLLIRKPSSGRATQEDLMLAQTEINALARSTQWLPEPTLGVMDRRDWLAGRTDSITLAQFAERVSGANLLGVAGIAQAEALANALFEQGIEAYWQFPGDHRAVDLEGVLAKVSACGQSIDAIVMTAKDAVKYGDLPLTVYVLCQTLGAPEPLYLALERIARGQSTS
jgi:tetraacyldisaccharide 4'-kinase